MLIIIAHNSYFDSVKCVYNKIGIVMIYSKKQKRHKANILLKF